MALFASPIKQLFLGYPKQRCHHDTRRGSSEAGWGISGGRGWGIGNVRLYVGGVMQDPRCEVREHTFSDAG